MSSFSQTFTCIAILLLMTACGTAPKSVSPTPTAPKSVSPTPAPSPKATPMGLNPSPAAQVQVDCSAAGNFRAPDFSPLPPGTSPHLLYETGEAQADPPADSPTTTLWSFDVSQNQTRKLLTLSMEPSVVSDEQMKISTDRHWIMVLQRLNDTESALRLLRVDGKEVQTLTCMKSDLFSRGWDWSPDRQFLAMGNEKNLQLLDLRTGKPRTVLTSKGESDVPKVYRWLDDTHLLVTFGCVTCGGGQDNNGIYLLDITSKQVSTVMQLPRLDVQRPKDYPFYTFDASADSKSLYVNHMSTPSGCPCAITAQSLPQTTTHTILQMQMFNGEEDMQVDPSNRTLLLLVTDDHDPEQDGIWKVSTDGRGLEQMLAFKQLDSTYQQRNNLIGDQTFFSNDGRYAIQYKETIIVGSLSSHQKTLFAQPVATEALVNVLGWTRP